MGEPTNRPTPEAGDTIRVRLEIGNVGGDGNWTGLLCDLAIAHDSQTGERVLSGGGAAGRGETLNAAAVAWIADRLNVAMPRHMEGKQVYTKAATGEAQRDGTVEPLACLLSPLTAKYVAQWRPDPDRPDTIIGAWAEDGSHYTLVVPTQLRPAIIAMQNEMPRLLAKKTTCQGSSRKAARERDEARDGANHYQAMYFAERKERDFETSRAAGNYARLRRMVRIALWWRRKFAEREALRSQAALGWYVAIRRADKAEAEVGRLTAIVKSASMAEKCDLAADAASWREQCEDARVSLLAISDLLRQALAYCPDRGELSGCAMPPSLRDACEKAAGMRVGASGESGRQKVGADGSDAPDATTDGKDGQE